MFNNSTNINPQRGGNLSTDSISFSSDCRRIGVESSDFSNHHQDKANVDTRDSALGYNSLPLYMVKESDRLISFKQSHWMKYMVDPQALSSAGFYYTGIDDKVKCFSCKGIIGDWNFTDNPWEEHAFWFPDCKFVLQEKGAIFVASIKKRWGQHLKMLSFSQQKEGYDTTDFFLKHYN